MIILLLFSWEAASIFHTVPLSFHGDFFLPSSNSWRDLAPSLFLLIPPRMERTDSISMSSFLTYALIHRTGVRWYIQYKFISNNSSVKINYYIKILYITILHTLTISPLPRVVGVNWGVFYHDYQEQLQGHLNKARYTGNMDQTMFNLEYTQGK